MRKCPPCVYIHKDISLHTFRLPELHGKLQQSHSGQINHARAVDELNKWEEFLLYTFSKAIDVIILKVQCE